MRNRDKLKALLDRHYITVCRYTKVLGINRESLRQLKNGDAVFSYSTIDKINNGIEEEIKFLKSCKLKK